MEGMRYTSGRVVSFGYSVDRHHETEEFPFIESHKPRGPWTYGTLLLSNRSNRSRAWQAFTEAGNCKLMYVIRQIKVSSAAGEGEEGVEETLFPVRKEKNRSRMPSLRREYSVNGHVERYLFVILR